MAMALFNGALLAGLPAHAQMAAPYALPPQAEWDVPVFGLDDGRHSFRDKLIKAPPDTPGTRLAKAFDDAAAVMPNRWYEKPKVEVLLDSGGYGRRIERVTGANGTYCITVESNHAPDGLDSMKDGIHPKVTSCGPHPPPVETTQVY